MKRLKNNKSLIKFIIFHVLVRSAVPRRMRKHKVTKNIFACAAHVVSDPGHVLKANNFLGALCLYAEEWNSLTYIYHILYTQRRSRPFVVSNAYVVQQILSTAAYDIDPYFTTLCSVLKFAATAETAAHYHNCLLCAIRHHHYGMSLIMFILIAITLIICLQCTQHSAMCIKANIATHTHTDIKHKEKHHHRTTTVKSF